MFFNFYENFSLQVVTPTGNTLVEDLTLKVEPGSNLLITGMHHLLGRGDLLSISVFIVAESLLGFFLVGNNDYNTG
jgi:hypothetical protein